MVKAYNKALHSDKIKLHRYAMQFYLPVSLGVRQQATKIHRYRAAEKLEWHS